VGISPRGFCFALGALFNSPWLSPRSADSHPESLASV